jgi:hypothetical protein
MEKWSAISNHSHASLFQFELLKSHVSRGSFFISALKGTVCKRRSRDPAATLEFSTM